MSHRHDWYQSEQKVVIDVLIKNANARNCTVDITANSVSIRGDDDIALNFDLSHDIDTTKSSFRVLSVKIEITLQKLAGERWTSLVKDKDCTNAVKIQAIPKTTEPATSTASSAATRTDKNWDRVVKDACEKEDIDQEEAKQITGLFEKIYMDSNEDVRRAMNKSFTESGGTVLSTNWNEVGAQTVTCKPPSGTEFKSWDQ